MAENLELLYKAVDDKKLIVFVGSGITRNLKNTKGNAMPTWSGLIDDVLRFASSEITSDLSNKTLEEKLKVIDAISELTKKSFKEKVLKANYSIAPKNFESIEIKNLFDTIIKISNGRIITTNYDDAFEVYDGLEEKYAFTTYKSAKDLIPLNVPTALTHATNFVAKIHGSQDETAIVFPSDYVSLYQEHGNSNEANKNLKAFLDNAIQNFPILFLGFSLSDEEINRITTNITTKFQNDTNTYFVIGHDNFSSEKKNVNFIQVDSEKDGSRLTPIVEKLEEIWSVVDAPTKAGTEERYNLFKDGLEFCKEKDKLYSSYITIFLRDYEAFKGFDGFEDLCKKVVEKIKEFGLDDSNIETLEKVKAKISTYSELVQEIDFELFKLEFGKYKVAEEGDKNTIKESVDALEKYQKQIIEFGNNDKSLKQSYNRHIEDLKNLCSSILKIQEKPDSNEDKTVLPLSDLLKQINLKTVGKQYQVQIIDDKQTLADIIVKQDISLASSRKTNLSKENRFYLVKSEREIVGFIDLKYIKKVIYNQDSDNKNTQYKISDSDFNFIFPTRIEDLPRYKSDSIMDILEQFTNASIKTNQEKFLEVDNDKIISPLALTGYNKETTILTYKSIFIKLSELNHQDLNIKLSNLSEYFLDMKSVTLDSTYLDITDIFESQKDPILVKDGIKKIGVCTYYHYLAWVSLAKLYKADAADATLKSAYAFEELNKNSSFLLESSSLKSALKYFADVNKEDFILIKTSNDTFKVMHYWSIFKYLLKQYNHGK